MGFQGDPLSPILLVMGMRLIHKALDEQCPTAKAASCVDDVLGIVPCTQVQKYLAVIQETAKTIGLNMNKAKCKVVPICSSSNKENVMTHDVLLGNGVMFLGINIRDTLDWGDEVQQRVEKTTKTLIVIKLLMSVF